MKDIVACMITVDRQLFGKENYLAETLKNLSRSGFFDNDRLAGFNLYSSRPDNDWISNPHNFCTYRFGGYILPARHLLNSSAKSLQANENAGYALEISGEYARDVDAKWENEYDLMIHEWMTATYPDNKYFLASVPSFVEHIGRQSVCTDKEETHRNPSWPGREWSYNKRQ